MQYFKKFIVLMILVIFLLPGCEKLNEVREEEFTGPSWDVDLAIPLLPKTEIEVGRELAKQVDKLEEELAGDENNAVDNGEEGEELSLSGDFELLEKTKLSDLDELEELEELKELTFNQEIDLEDYGLDEFDEEIDNLKGQKIEENIEMKDLLESSLSGDFTVPTEEFDDFDIPDLPGDEEKFEQVIEDFNFADYQGKIEGIEDEISGIGDNIDIKDMIDDDNGVLDDILSYIENDAPDQKFIDEVFELDIPDDQSGELDDILAGIEKSLEMPEMPEEDEDAIIEEIGSQLEGSADIIFYEELEDEETYSGDDLDELQLDFTDQGFERLEFADDSGKLVVDIDNGTSTDIDITVGLVNEGAIEAFTEDDGDGTIAKNGTGKFELKLAGKEMANKVNIEITVDPVDTIQAGGSLTLDMYPEEDQEGNPDISIKSVVMEESFEIETFDFSFEEEFDELEIKEIEFRGGNLNISIDTVPDNLEDELGIDFENDLKIKIGEGDEAFELDIGENSLIDDDLPEQFLDLTETVKVEFTEAINKYIKDAEITINFDFNVENKDIRKVVLKDNITIEEWDIPVPDDLQDVKEITFNDGSLNVDFEALENGENVTQELSDHDFAEENIAIIIGEEVFHDGDELENKTFDFSDGIEVSFTEQFNTIFSGIDLNVEISLEDVTNFEVILKEDAAIEIPENTVIETMVLPGLPEDIANVIIDNGSLELVIDDGELDLKENIDIDIKLNDTKIPADSDEKEDEFVYDLDGLEIEGEEELKIIINGSVSKYVTDQDLTYGVQAEINFGKVNFTEESSYEHSAELEFSLSDYEELDDIIDHLLEITLAAGKLDLVLDDLGLDLDFDLDLKLDGTPLDVKSKENLIYEIPDDFVIAITDEDSIEIDLETEITINHFYYPEELPSEDDNIKISGQFTELDWKDVKISNYQQENLDPFSEIDIDLEEDTKITFTEGSTLTVELDFGESEPLEDYNLELNLKGLYDEENNLGTVVEINPDDPGPHKVEIDLDGKTLDISKKMDITFVGRYIQGTEITAEFDIDISEIELENYTVQRNEEIYLGQLPAGIREINFDDGQLVIEIEHEGLAISIDELSFVTHLDDYKFKYDEDQSTDSQTVYSLDLKSIILSQEDFKDDSQNGNNDISKPYLSFNVTVDSYDPDKADDIQVEGFFEDLDVGLVKLDPEEFKFSEDFRLSDFMDLEEVSDFVESIKLKEGTIEIEIDDPVFDTKICSDTLLLKIGEQEITVDQEQSDTEEGKYVFDLTDIEINFTDDPEFEFNAGLESLDYSTERDDPVEIKGSIENLDWEEVNISRTGVEKKITEFEETIQKEFEDPIKLELGEFRDYLKQVGLIKEIINLKILIDNQTPLAFNLELEIEAYAYAEDEDQDEDLLEEDDDIDGEITLSFNAFDPDNPGDFEFDLLQEGEVIGKFIDILETYPDYLKVNVNEISIPDSEDNQPFTFTSESSIAAAVEYDIGFGLKVKAGDTGDFEIKHGPEPVNIGEDEQEQLLSFPVKEGIINYEIWNQLPFNGKATLYLGLIDEDKIGEDDQIDETTKKEFFEDGEENGNKDDEHPIYTFDLVDLQENFNEGRLELKEDVIELLTEENVYSGVKFTIFIDNEDEEKDIIFSLEDKITMKMWSSIKFRVNPEN